ncbi:hypothetical protein C8R45DRAFT_1105020 [Mycena sanguinolenta]|nr:hypothetical protein C8R45DRAFT_1105020 [Mycena sanguinolenta]
MLVFYVAEARTLVQSILTNSSRLLAEFACVALSGLPQDYTILPSPAGMRMRSKFLAIVPTARAASSPERLVGRVRALFAAWWPHAVLVATILHFPLLLKFIPLLHDDQGSAQPPAFASILNEALALLRLEILPDSSTRAAPRPVSKTQHAWRCFETALSGLGVAFDILYGLPYAIFHEDETRRPRSRMACDFQSTPRPPPAQLLSHPVTVSFNPGRSISASIANSPPMSPIGSVLVTLDLFKHAFFVWLSQFKTFLLPRKIVLHGIVHRSLYVLFLV